MLHGLCHLDEGFFFCQGKDSQGLSQENQTNTKAEFFIVTQDGEYLIDLNDSRQNGDVVLGLMPLISGVARGNRVGKWVDSERMRIFALKHGEISYGYHELRMEMIVRIFSCDLARWRVETQESIV